ncbi:hypothetical protein GCM10022244_42450 [Streptomyces gulbargensis]|uniref:Uncharacterized protein n=1 Tax=Streptomyces gulbargensis TaxID=364901 RepID=A0ABP7MVF3_9ACTN
MAAATAAKAHIGLFTHHSVEGRSGARKGSRRDGAMTVAADNTVLRTSDLFVRADRRPAIMNAKSVRVTAQGI